MPHMEFEPTLPVFEWAKFVHALDCAATVIGYELSVCLYDWYYASHVYILEWTF
jgi:hypothetical protein